MGYITLATILCICFSSTLATYGSEYHKNNHGSEYHKNNHGSDEHYDGPKGLGGIRGHYDGPRVNLDEQKIHLNSAKIILDRPSINVHRDSYSPLHDDEPIILENEKPLYIRKTLHGIPSSSLGHAVHAAAIVHGPAVHAAPVLHRSAIHGSLVHSGALLHSGSPVIVDSGYSSGKVLDISAPIQVINHAPVVQERAILIRRPIVVSKGLTTTQDHLERLHFAHTGLGHAGGYALPLSKGLHERTVVYSGGHGLGHGYGGHLVSDYSAPVIVDQQKAYLGHAGIGYASGKALHGGSLHGGALHGGSLHGGSLHSGSLHGGALHGSLHGSGTLKKY